MKINTARAIAIVLALLGMFSMGLFAPHTFFWGAMFGICWASALNDLTDIIKERR